MHSNDISEEQIKHCKRKPIQFVIKICVGILPEEKRENAPKRAQTELSKRVYAEHVKENKL